MSVQEPLLFSCADNLTLYVLESLVLKYNYKVGILLTFGKHLHDHIIWLKKGGFGQ
jgi:hypothetical protein